MSNRFSWNVGMVRFRIQKIMFQHLVNHFWFNQNVVASQWGTKRACFGKRGDPCKSQQQSRYCASAYSCVNAGVFLESVRVCCMVSRQIENVQGIILINFWSNRFSVLLLERPKTKNSMISGFVSPWEPLIYGFIDLNIPKILSNI